MQNHSRSNAIGSPLPAEAVSSGKSHLTWRLLMLLSLWAIAFTLSPAMFANAQTPAAMINPAPGTILTGSSVSFQWTSPSGANDFWLYVGTAAGQNNIFGNELGMSTSQTVNNIPIGGVYVRLWTRFGTSWYYADYVYTDIGGTGGPAVLTAPPLGSRVTSPTVTFQWTTGIGATDFWIYVGTTPGGSDLFNSEMNMATSQVVTNIPDGTMYVRLWTRVGTTWYFRDYTYSVLIIGDDYPWIGAAQDSVNVYSGFYTRECTDFVAWRMNRDRGDTKPSTFWFTNSMTVAGAKKPVWGDAINWMQHAKDLGYTVDQSPAVGAVAYFNLGGIGHVAYVESVNANGTVNVSEYNYKQAFMYDYRQGVTPTAYLHIVH